MYVQVESQIIAFVNSHYNNYTRSCGEQKPPAGYVCVDIYKRNSRSASAGNRQVSLGTMCYIFTSHSNLLICIVVVVVVKLHGVRQAFPSLTNQTKDYFYKV